MPSVIVLSWLGVFAEDVDRFARFYGSTLDLPIIEQREDLALLRVGTAAILEIWGGGQSERGCKTPERQSMMIGFEVADFDAALEDMRRKNLTPDGEPGGSGASRWAHFLDPEGNRFELKQSRSRSPPASSGLNAG